MISKIYNKLIIGAFLLLLTSLPVAAEGFFDDVEMKARLGYSIGGTALLGMPASIRSIEAFHVTPNFQLGFDVAKPLGGQWGVQTGLMLENKGMDGEVMTKAYRIKVRMDESEMEGYYTGRVRQKVTEWMLTLPVQATCQLGQRRSEIDDVERVDVAVVVDILVDSIATLEQVVLTDTVVGVVEHHAYRVTIIVEHHLTRFAEGDGCCVSVGYELLSLCGRHIEERLVLVLIDTLVAETVYGAEGVV